MLVDEAAEVSVEGWDFSWRADARAAGLDVVECRNERLDLELFDVGAMVYFLRKVIWTVPDFTVDRYRPRLEALHHQIERDGAFRSTMSRTLVEARKPSSPRHHHDGPAVLARPARRPRARDRRLPEGRR